MELSEFIETSDGIDIGGVFAYLERHRIVAGPGSFRSLAPNADVLASGAFWRVTTAAAAILIAVFVLHRHFRSHHLRSRVRFELLPTATFDPSPRAVLAFAHQLGGCGRCTGGCRRERSGCGSGSARTRSSGRW
ncbi:hypothetical protein [Amycolatopsis sp. lyj-109]|uniref:hypothetical protein n=1 Tax=Amycolatopsis sp. lyj-109 TaxID=2789287 RepID=UPI00397AE70D